MNEHLVTAAIFALTCQPEVNNNVRPLQSPIGAQEEMGDFLYKSGGYDLFLGN